VVRPAIRVAVADAHAFVRAGITQAFRETDDLRVVACVADLTNSANPMRIRTKPGWAPKPS